MSQVSTSPHLHPLVDTCGQGGPEKEGYSPDLNLTARESIRTIALPQLCGGFATSLQRLLFFGFSSFWRGPSTSICLVLSAAVYLFPWSLALFVVSPVLPLLTSLPLFSSGVSLGADECLLSLPPVGPRLWFGMRPRG